MPLGFSVAPGARSLLTSTYKRVRSLKFDCWIKFRRLTPAVEKRSSAIIASAHGNSNGTCGAPCTTTLFLGRAKAVAEAEEGRQAFIDYGDLLGWKFAVRGPDPPFVYGPQLVSRYPRPHWYTIPTDTDHGTFFGPGLNKDSLQRALFADARETATRAVSWYLNLYTKDRDAVRRWAAFKRMCLAPPKGRMP